MTKEEAKLVLDNARPQTKEIDRQFYDDEDLNNALDMAIKALEIVEEFEKAQIITGGRLNGRTYAYKCGLEDGKRKALEQQTINCNATTEEIAQSFKTDVEAVKDYFPKCNSMEFPKTFDEFANDYGFTDDKEIYTNGSHLIPVFRVKQWLDYIEQQHSDCVSRKKVYYMITGGKYANEDYEQFIDRLVKELENMPPVTPIHGTCKDCKHNHKNSRNTFECSNGHRFYMRIPDTFYCADYEKRGNEE